MILWHARALARRVRFRLADRLTPCDPAPRIEAAVTRLRARNGPLRVGFVVCDPSKWSAGPLFDRLAGDSAFEVAFHAGLSDTGTRLPRKGRRAQFSDICTFFGRIGPLREALYDPVSDRMCPLSHLQTDLVFIQQPWGMQDLPRQLLGAGILSAYVHYGYPIVRNDRMQFGMPDFHRFLWAYIAASPLHRDMVAGGPAPPHRVIVAGHPKLDIYRAPAPARDSVRTWPRPDDTTRLRVIFGPHHTLDGTLNMGTFGWSGAAMLDLVRAYPQVDFLLKPHPNLAVEMERRGKTQDFIDWQAAWAAAPNTARFDSGNYFDLFRSSDMMITDSGSFLAEYLPTGQPILRLTRPDAAPMNAAGQALIPAFYTADNAPALHARFAEILIDRQDPLAAARVAKATLLVPNAQASAETVRDELLRSLCPHRSAAAIPERPAPGAGPDDAAGRAGHSG